MMFYSSRDPLTIYDGLRTKNRTIFWDCILCSTARRYCTNPLALPLAGLQREMCSSSRRNCQKFGAVPLHLKSGTARVRLHFRKRGCRSGRAFPLAGMQQFFLHLRVFFLLAVLHTKYYSSACGHASFSLHSRKRVCRSGRAAPLGGSATIVLHPRFKLLAVLHAKHYFSACWYARFSLHLRRRGCRLGCASPLRGMQQYFWIPACGTAIIFVHLRLFCFINYPGLIIGNYWRYCAQIIKLLLIYAHAAIGLKSFHVGPTI